MKSINDLDRQWTRIRDGILRNGGRYDREFGGYNSTRAVEGELQRVRGVYRAVRSRMESQLNRMGAYETGLTGPIYDRTKRVVSNAPLANSNG